MQQIRLLFLSCTILSFIMLSCNQEQKANEAAVVSDTTVQAMDTAPPPAPQQVIVDKNKLAGAWERTDAPYQLKISELAEGGSMKAGYFNPNPINVDKASWINDNGQLQMYIELRDVNYPGSNYTLTYYPQQDMLSGRYYQAVEGVTYPVEFTRVK